MKIALYLTLVTAAGLSACSSAPRIPDYSCPLNDVAGAKCASVEQAYSAARSMNRDDSQTRVQSVFDSRVQRTTAPERPAFQGQLSNYPEPGQTGMPVFQQPKVMRPWIAPYVDADGNLRSGEYSYFATPGRWNYGEMRKPGAAAGIFEPSRPGQLGFTPSAVPGRATNAPPRPAEPAARPSGSQGASNTGSLMTPSAKPADGAITQPYQRLQN